MKMTMLAGLMMVSAVVATGCAAGAEPTEEGQTADEGKPVAEESTAQTSEALQIGTTHDQCSSSNFRVFNTAGQFQLIPHDSTFHRVDVPSRRITWTCGGTTEYATCNPGTTFVKVRHIVGERQIDWSCQQ